MIFVAARLAIRIWHMLAFSVEGAMYGPSHVKANNHKILPPGLLAQVVPSHPSDFQLRGSSPCINTYLPKKKKKKKKIQS